MVKYYAKQKNDERLKNENNIRRESSKIIQERLGNYNNRITIEDINFENQSYLTLLEKFIRIKEFFIDSSWDNNKSTFNFYLLPITLEEVTEIIQKTTLKTAECVDEIYGKVLRWTSAFICTTLSYFSRPQNYKKYISVWK